MSVYTDRTGQRVGDFEVIADHGRGKRRRRGGRRVIWRCYDHATGRTQYLRTERIIRLDREQIASESSGQ